ncbi:MAG: ABC transporter permease [Candidatus Dormiibacterota bacterium]
MRLLIRRFGFYIVAAWAALSFAFLIPRVIPGNPIAAAIIRAETSGTCNSICVHAIELQLGFDVHTTLWTQYLQYWGNLFHGNLGFSWSENSQVGSLILSYLPWTLGLLGVSTVLAFLAGTLIGAVMAWRRGSWVEWVMPAAAFFQAIPYFFLGLVLVLIFGQTGTMLKWFPSLFGYDIYGANPGMNWPYISSIIEHAFLPALTVVLASIAGFILTMRNNMLSTMDEDFVLVARAKGLPNRRVVWYAARNAMLPVVSNFTIALSLVVAGQILVEIVFNYPGIGYHLFQALGELDYTLVQGIFVVIVLVVLAANLLADVVYVLIDPRARQEA